MSSVGLFKTFCNFFVRKSQVPDKEKAKMTEITETYLEAFPDLKKMSVKELVKEPEVKDLVKEPEVKEPVCSECCNECKNLETIDLKVDSPIVQVSKVTFAPILVDITEAPILSDIIGIDSPVKEAAVEKALEEVPVVEAPVEKALEEVPVVEAPVEADEESDEEAAEESDEESDEEVAVEKPPIKEAVEEADEQAYEGELTPDFIHLTEPEGLIFNKDELVAGSPDEDLTPEFRQLPESPEAEDFILNKDDLLAGSPESINLLDSYKPKESNIHDLD